jgi:hypothetical protein
VIVNTFPGFLQVPGIEPGLAMGLVTAPRLSVNELTSAWAVYGEGAAFTDVALGPLTLI